MRHLFRNVAELVAIGMIVLVSSKDVIAQVPADKEPRDDNSQVAGPRDSIETEVVELLDKLIREQHVRPFWLQSEREYEATVRQAKERVAREDLSREQR